MKVWIHINGVQEGPYELSELPLDRMTPETPVWYEGMQNWMPAGSAVLTAELFGCRPAERAQPTAEEEKPATYIVWSLLFTILCCNPIGIIPLVLGTMVNSKYRNYDYDGAKRMSETTAWWLMITIVTSLILAPFSFLVSL